MKKLIISIIFFFILSNTLLAQEFWSNKNDGPTSVEAAKKIFSGRKLDYIEGIWFDDQLGTVVIFEDDVKFIRTNNTTGSKLFNNILSLY